MAATTVAHIMERDAPATIVEHGRHVGLVTRADVLAAPSAAEA
jgi:predicted transcriptional regulator